MWQATHPDAYIPAAGLVDSYGTYTIAPNTVETSKTQLTPFTSDTSGTLWDSDTARYTSTWGYTYPEIADWSQSPADLAANVTAQVNKLYGPSSGSHLRRTHPRDLSTATTKTKEWFVRISVDKFELDTSFIILLFLGSPAADTSTWKGASNLAGSLYVSLPPSHRKEKGHMTTHGEVPLKEALHDAGLADYSEKSVVGYLKGNLQWRVQRTDGRVVDTVECESLRIEVRNEEVVPAGDEFGFPRYGAPTSHPEITKGKAGGV